jgi:hypothetical protein
MKLKSKHQVAGKKTLRGGGASGLNPLFIALSLLFMLSTGHLFWFARGVFAYVENSTLFIYSAEYLKQFINHPGGLLVYAGNFLSQGCFNPLFGSLVVSALLVTLCLVLSMIYRRLSAQSSFALLFILLPSCLLLLLQIRYNLPLHIALGYLMASCLFYSIIPAGNRLRMILPALFIPFYHLAIFCPGLSGNSHNLQP